MRKDYASGFGMLVLSAVLFSVMGACVKLSKAYGIDSLTLLFYRFLIGVLFVLILKFLGIARLRFARKGLLFWRGVLGAIGVLVFFVSVHKIGLGRSGVLTFTFPIFAAIYAPFLLKEKANPLVAGAIVVSFSGLFLMSPFAGGASVSRFYFCLALFGGGVLGGFCVIIIKKLRETTDPYTIYLSQAFFGLLMCVICISYIFFGSGDNVNLPGRGWHLILLVGIIASVGQIIMTYAYKYVPATQAGLVAMLTPVFNMVVAISLFKEELTGIEIAGAVLVLLSCFAVFYFESRKGVAAVRPAGPSSSK